MRESSSPIMNVCNDLIPLLQTPRPVAVFRADPEMERSVPQKRHYSMQPTKKSPTNAVRDSFYSDPNHEPARRTGRGLEAYLSAVRFY